MATLVDASVWVDYFRSADGGAPLRRALEEGDAIVVPGLVLAEILQGLASDAEAARVLNLLEAFMPTPELERSDYVAAARLYRACRAAGRTPRGAVDCLLAQLCVRYDYQLLARDRDFEGLGRIAPLRLRYS